jgi:CheY-like chemotaxis protein
VLDDKRQGGLPEGMQMSSNEPMTIVLIEDDAGHARLIERNLQRARLPHTLVVLQDGSRAADYFFPSSAPPARRTTPRVILLDLHLQGLQGLQVLARLKNAPQTRHIPVIILSTTEDPDTIETCYALGCNAYLTPPVEAARFAEALQTLGVWLSHIAIPKGKPSCA